MRNKVTVIGGGQTGGAITQRLAEIPYIDVVLIDTNEGVPQGKALDLAEASSLVGYSGKVTGSTTWEAATNTDILILTAGAPRKPNMSREDLLQTNAQTLRKVVPDILTYCPEAIIIVFTNPMDAMCHLIMKETGFPRERIIGMGGTLDSARFRSFIAWELGVSVEDVSAYVLGGHTEATMLPIVSTASVGGLPITSLIPNDRLEAIVKRTQNGGGEIVSLLKNGSAFYAPSAATVEIVESILLDKNRVLPCCVYLQGEYGIQDAFVGVPTKLGTAGVTGVLEALLSSTEMAGMRQAGDTTRKLVSLL